MNTVQGKTAHGHAEAPIKGSNGVRKRYIALIVALVGAAVAGTYGFRALQFALAHEDTDDAQVEGDVSPVLPRVPGYVAAVLVKDNEHVTAGQPLVRIDPREVDLRVAAAEAALRNATADKSTAEASLSAARGLAETAEANVETALVRQRKAAYDLVRDTKLAQTGAITDSQLNDTQAAADTAAAQLASARSEARVAGLQIDVAAARVAAAETTAAERSSDLDFARLQKSYASVDAPISGIVSRKSVEPGQFVQSGQTLMSIASDSDPWVVANFKETQLTRMHPGQEATFEADSYPGVTFQGRIDSISGATGARFALLPPDNASGNFVKVTQRVPVKVVLAQAPDAGHPLRPGMSVTVTVGIAP